MQNFLKLLFSITLLFLLSSCGGDDDSTDTMIEIPTPTSDFYLLGNFDGTAVLVESNNGTINDAGSLCDNNNFDSKERKQLYRNVLQIIAT